MHEPTQRTLGQSSIYRHIWQPLVPCKPPTWARGGHLQTLLGHFIPSVPFCAASQVMQIDLDDGDKLALSYFKGNTNLAVYLFHGLGGDSSSGYMRRMMKHLTEAGHHVFAVDHRGCGKGEGQARKPYHSGSAADISRVLSYGKSLLHDCLHLAVGFSLSGNALLLLLAENNISITHPDFAISVNPPIHLEKCSLLIKSGMNKIYDINFSKKCRAQVQRRVKAGLIDPHSISIFSSVYDFDEIYTARAAGFIDRSHYYQSCSTYERMHQIQTPTFILSSYDDPFISYQDFKNAKKSSQVYCHLEPVGGHMGYIGRKHPRFGRRWLDYALMLQIEAIAERFR